MKNVLILGATGGIGSLVIQQLKQVADVKQTVYVRNSSKLRLEDVTAAATSTVKALTAVQWLISSLIW